MTQRLAVLTAALVFCAAHTVHAQTLSGDELATAEANFKSADADADGSLTRQEFENFVNANAEANLGRASMIKRMGMYGRAFGRIDANEDEKATWEEFAAASNGNN